MATVKSKKPVSKLKAGQKKKTNKWLIVGGIAAVAIIGAVVVRFSSAATCKSLTFKQGSSGQCVKNIQGMTSAWLVKNDTSRYLTVDGKYGPKTADYVRVFQAQRKLPVTGTVNPATWRELCNLQMGGTGGTAPHWINVVTIYGKNAGCW